MNRSTKDTLINLAVMGVILSAASLVFAAKSNWRVPDIISLETSDLPPKADELAQADVEPTVTPNTDIHGPTPTPKASPTPVVEPRLCFCNAVPTPSPTPYDGDIPPIPTPTPDTSSEQPPFTISVNPFL